MLNIAKKLALRSEHRQHHHACILTKGGKIIAAGYNHRYMHAERDALEHVYPYSLNRVLMYYGDFPVVSKEWAGKNFTLYSFRWRKNGTWGNAMPCRNCRSMLQKLNITKVYYTNEKGQLVRL